MRGLQEVHDCRLFRRRFDSLGRRGWRGLPILIFIFIRLIRSAGIDVAVRGEPALVGLQGKGVVMLISRQELLLMMTGSHDGNNAHADCAAAAAAHNDGGDDEDDHDADDENGCVTMMTVMVRMPRLN